MDGFLPSLVVSNYCLHGAHLKKISSLSISDTAPIFNLTRSPVQYSKDIFKFSLLPPFPVSGEASTHSPCYSRTTLLFLLYGNRSASFFLLLAHSLHLSQHSISLCEELARRISCPRIRRFAYFLNPGCFSNQISDVTCLINVFQIFLPDNVPSTISGVFLLLLSRPSEFALTVTKG